MTRSATPKPRRSGVVVPHRPKWHGEIAAFSISLFGRLLATSWRMEIDDPQNLMREDGPFIAAIWHNRLAVAMPVWKIWQSRHPGAQLAALISASRDGALLARTYSYFGVQPIRGSSSRRGPQALLELTRALEDKCNVAITPDGPRGPKYRVQTGIIALAQVTQTPIVPIGVQISRRKALRSWDSFQIPLPFARCRVSFGERFHVARELSPDQQEIRRAALETALLKINPD